MIPTKEALLECQPDAVAWAREKLENDPHCRLPLPASVYAGDAPKMSNRYTSVASCNIVRTLHGRGWVVRDASATTTDDPRYGRHMLRFGRVGSSEMVRPELVMINSHDGSSTYRFYAGLFRFVCANGLVVADSTFGGVCVQHRGDLSAIVDAMDRTIEGAELATNAALAWGCVKLPDESRVKLAMECATLRPGVHPLDLIRPKRWMDEGRDLWTVFNVIQEHLLRGGDWVKSRKTRPIKEIGKTIELNQKVWDIASKYAQN